MINWHVYDMIHCDAICYDMRCIWGDVMLKTWNVMLYLLNCMYTTWYEWHEITINDMKYNPVRIMYDMRTEKWETICEMIWKTIWYVQNASGVVLNDNKNGKMLGPTHASGDTPIPSRGYRRVHRLGRRSIIMFYIMLLWRLLILMGVRQKLNYQRRLAVQEKGPSGV